MVKNDQEGEVDGKNLIGNKMDIKDNK